MFPNGLDLSANLLIRHVVRLRDAHSLLVAPRLKSSRPSGSTREIADIFNI